MRPTERLTVLVLVALSAAFAVTHPPGSGPRLLLLAAFFAALGLAVRLGDRRGPAGLPRDLLPVLALAMVYGVLQPLIEALNPVRWDQALAALDERWFGRLAAAWRGLLGRPPPFTDAVYAAYASYYALPLGVYFAIRWRHPEDSEEAGVTLLATFYLSYLGYLAMPTSGPRLPPGAEAQLGGGAISAAVRAFLGAAEATTLDAFPSGHTALSILPVMLAARRFPRAVPALAAWAAAVVFSTVYIQVHYVVDVVAGVALAVAGFLLGPPLHRWLGGTARPAP